MCRNIMLEAELDSRESMRELFLKLWKSHITNYYLYLTREEVATIPKQTLKDDFLLYIQEELKTIK